MVIKPKPTMTERATVAILVMVVTETVVAADLLPLEPEEVLEEEESVPLALEEPLLLPLLPEASVVASEVSVLTVPSTVPKPEEPAEDK